MREKRSSGVGLIVRRAGPDDAEQVAQILNDAARYKLERGDRAWGAATLTAWEVERRLAAGTTHVACVQGLAVATLMVLWEDEMMWGRQPPNAAYVHQLAVRSGHHGLGVGSAVLDWAAARAGDRGRHWLRVDCPPDNHRLRTYYEARGFRWVADREIQARRGVYLAALYERPAQPPGSGAS